MQVSQSSHGPALVAADLPEPQPSADEVLIRVCAAGVTPTELGWFPTKQAKDGAPRKGAVPSHEFSGVIAGLGRNVRGFEVGQEVYGLNDWFADGATAEFCVTQPGSIALKPASLTHEESATVPIGALTAWQGLLERTRIKPGERVLVHAAAGSVGIFAVQLAHLHGAHVIATASSRNLKLVAELGAAEVIDYQSTRFEEQTGKVDVVFDGVGGETLDRSWGMLRPGGRLVTIVDDRNKDIFFIVEPNQKQLIEVAELLDAGKIKTFLGPVVPMAEASSVYEADTPKTGKHGKVVVAITR
jgi:NADPH:quinone reductase-like Zn-dependent oxidoreductase